MAQLTIPRAEWTNFFNSVADSLLGKQAEIEVASLDLGDQVVNQWIPMIGVTYDSKDDLVDVALDRLDHLIRRPREIVVDQGPLGVESITVVDHDGAKQIIKLKDPLLLPPAATA